MAPKKDKNPKSAEATVLNMFSNAGAQKITSRGKANSSASSSSPTSSTSSTSENRSDAQKPKAEKTTSPTQSDPQDSIVKVLKERLPLFPFGEGSSFSDNKFFKIDNPSGKSTQAATPPMAWLAEDMKTFLDTYFTKEFMNITASYKLPQLEKSFRILVEADVVRASALYLIHVVNIATQEWLDKQGGGYVLKFNAEVEAKDNTTPEKYITRTDIQWTLETTADAKEEKPKDPRIVAVMEYKRKHLINEAELQAARYYPASDEVATFMERADTDGGGPTYFKNTSMWLMKQAKSYQVRRKTVDVCLYDWDTMFILNFAGFNPDEKMGKSESSEEEKNESSEEEKNKSSEEEKNLWPAGILYQEQAKTSGKEPETTFRSLLLAFLIRALKRMPELSKNPPPPPTYDQSPKPASVKEADPSTGNAAGGDKPAQPRSSDSDKEAGSSTGNAGGNNPAQPKSSSKPTNQASGRNNPVTNATQSRAPGTAAQPAGNNKNAAGNNPQQAKSSNPSGPQNVPNGPKDKRKN